MKNPQVFVGAGFKPALRREIDLIRPGNAQGGIETRPYGCLRIFSSFGVAYAMNVRLKG